jgi:uncharacterized protein YecE (DUF72 family)
MTIKVGTCAWADAALIDDGSFYPKKSMSAEARLRYYARFFDTVEINSSYYAIPAARNVARWAERTPPGFVFNVKAYGLLTGHNPRPETLPDEVQAMLPARVPLTHRGEVQATALSGAAIETTFRLFRASLGPLEDASKLGYVLFQFAPWVRFGSGRLDDLEALPGRLPGCRIAVEFRDRSWFPDHADETLAVLRSAGLAHVIVDAPPGGAAGPRVVARTAPSAVFRLHGRNAEGWAPAAGRRARGAREVRLPLFGRRAARTARGRGGHRRGGGRGVRVVQQQQSRLSRAQRPDHETPAGTACDRGSPGRARRSFRRRASGRILAPCRRFSFAAPKSTA